MIGEKSQLRSKPLDERRRSGSKFGGVLGVHELNVSAKHTIEQFSCFWSRTLWACHGLFGTDDLIAFRAFAETMTGVIHFVPWSKPTHGGQFWLFHVLSFPHAAFWRYPVGFKLHHYRKLIVVISRLHSLTIGHRFGLGVNECKRLVTST